VDRPLHEDLQPLAFLVGTWRGPGKGSYPTTDPFAYDEEIAFTHIGKPFLKYTQATKHPEKGFPMHAEMGYWRIGPGNHVEVLLVHPTGVAEIQEGTVDGNTVELKTTSVTRTSTAKEVNGLERTFTLENEVLRYEVRMAAVGVPMTPHLSAELRRVD
jgi:hypothetical protein